MHERAHLWILNGKVPEACLDVIRWGRWMEDANRHVANDYLAGGEVRISTVFLGLDHNYCGGEPILFESMVFGEEHIMALMGRTRPIREELDMRRYHTWDEAEAGHRELVTQYRALIEEAKRVFGEVMKNPGTVGQ